MQEILDRLLAECPGADPEYLEASDWLGDLEPGQVDAVVEEYHRRYDARLVELERHLGPPQKTEKTHRIEIEEWYPEILRAACWRRNYSTLCLALEHQDAETPVGIVLRCLSDDEIRELSA